MAEFGCCATLNRKSSIASSLRCFTSRASPMSLSGSGGTVECPTHARRKRRGSFDNRQHVSRIDGAAFGGDQLLHDSRPGGLDFVLHLHGLDHEDALAGFDLGFFRDQQAHDLAGHGRDQLSRALFVGARALAAAQGSGIAQFGGIAHRAEPQVEVGGGALTFDLVRLAVDDDREHVPPGKNRIYLDLAAVEAALPMAVNAVEFQAVVLAVDGDVVDHELGTGLWAYPLLRLSLLPSFFHSETALAPLPAPLPAPVASGSRMVNSPAAIAATQASSRLISGGGVLSRRSRYPVSRRPERNPGSLKMRRKSEILVLMPPTKYSLSARIRREMACSRLEP